MLLSGPKRSADIQAVEALLTRARLAGNAIEKLVPKELRVFRAVIDKIVTNSQLFAPLVEAGFTDYHIIEYVRFLLLKVHYRDIADPPMFSPSEPVDTIWHAHMLVTQDYVDVCYVLLGSDTRGRPLVFFHDPSTATDANRLHRYALTKQRYAQLFGEEPPSGLWGDESPKPPQQSSSGGGGGGGQCAEGDDHHHHQYMAEYDIMHRQRERGTKRGNDAHYYQYFVKTLRGKTITLQMWSTSSIGEVRQAISEVTGVTKGAIRLIFAGKQLEDGRDMAFYRIDKESTLHMVLRLGGC